MSSTTDTSDRVRHQLALAQLDALTIKAELRDLRARLVCLRAPRRGATTSSPLVLVVLTLLAGAGAFFQGVALAAIVGGGLR